MTNALPSRSLKIGTPLIIGRAQPGRSVDALPKIGPADFVWRHDADDAILADRPEALALVLDRANVGVMHRDFQRRLLFVNPHFCAILGRTPEELDDHPLAAFIHPDDLGQSLATFEAHRDRVEPYEIEQRYLRADGQAVWCAVRISFVPDKAGRAASVIIVAADISEKHRAMEALRESEEHYRYSVELNPEISWSANPQGEIEKASQRWRDVTGIDLRDALGHRWTEAVHPDDRAAAGVAWQTSLASGAPVDVEYRLQTIDGSFRWYRARAAPRRDAQGRIVHWYGTLEDIHDKHVAIQTLRDSEERFRLAAEAAGLGIWDYDADRQQRTWSAEMKRLFGFPEDVTPTIEAALARVIPEDLHIAAPQFTKVHVDEVAVSPKVAFRIRRADDGRERWISMGQSRTLTPEGLPSRILITMRDVTEERTAEERVRWIALHDSLTGLPNRSLFNQMLDGALRRAESAGGRLGLILLDVDRLKEVNDLIGHDAGDTLLKTLAARALEAVGTRGIVSRLGGDEFAILLNDADEPDVRLIAGQLMPLLRQPFTFQGYTLDSQATAGASLFPDHGTAAADLLKAADMALYAGKAERRGNVSLFRPEMLAAMRQRSSMLRQARSVVQEAAVVPFYQPKVSLCDGRVIGFEALLRWRHPRLGIQAPTGIALAFDDIDIATDLSELMLDQMVRDMRGWLDRGLDFGRIAFNLSPAEFRRDNLYGRILDRLRRADIPPSRFELEVTETVFLGQGAEKVAAELRAFHEAGVTIALDDFGTGYASLTHLKAFPVDVIKIDRSFVANLTSARDDAAIVNAVIALGRDLDMAVVAEGVETDAQAEHLRGQRCQIAQGYLFGKAMPADSAAALLG